MPPADPPPATTAAPHVHLLVLPPGEAPQAAVTVPPGFVMRRIDGRRARTKAALLDEVARALDLPEDTGRNWDALEERLADLEWLPARGYVLVVGDADQLLAEAPAEDYRTFVALLQDVGREWATPRAGEWPRPAVPFHVYLAVPRGRETARADWGTRAPGHGGSRA